MSAGHPEPVTPLASDAHIRSHTAYDLEETLVTFIKNIVAQYRLDNPTLNLAQPEIVPYEPAARQQTSDLKVSPRVVRGRIPRTVTGEVELDKISDLPAIIVQSVSARIDYDCTLVTARILVATYDENPDGSGYQDVLNLIEAIAFPLTSYGQAGLDRAYPISLPIEWKLLEHDSISHYGGEMTTHWKLPSGRPLPDRSLSEPYIGPWPHGS